MHFLFLAAQFEFMTRFPIMILYFRVGTDFTAGPNIKWDVLHALQFCTGRYSPDVTRMHANIDLAIGLRNDGGKARRRSHIARPATAPPLHPPALVAASDAPDEPVGSRCDRCDTYTLDVMT